MISIYRKIVSGLNKKSTEIAVRWIQLSSIIIDQLDGKPNHFHRNNLT